MAHSAQVQKVAICPSNHERMASVGYDNSVRIWDLSTMQVTLVIEDKASKTERDGQINALSWSPTSEDILCIGTVSGKVKIVDTRRSKVTAWLELCTATIFETTWNQEYLVACSEN